MQVIFQDILFVIKLAAKPEILEKVTVRQIRFNISSLEKCITQNNKMQNFKQYMYTE